MSESTVPRLKDFLAVNRGGGLYSEAVSQPAGSAIALVASRLSLAPTVLSLINLVIGLGSSVVVVALSSRAAAGVVPGWAVGLIALIGWQVAYAFDCSDGQLARVTGQASPAGARLDILCDVASQIGIVAALSSMAVAYRPATPVWLVAAFTGSWMVNLITSVLQSGPSSASMVPSRSLPVRIIKLIRDPGVGVGVPGLVLTLVPQWTVAVLWVLTVVNGLFLLASIAFSARSALRTAPRQ